LLSDWILVLFFAALFQFEYLVAIAMVLVMAIVQNFHGSDGDGLSMWKMRW
jgi:hypothetical protein